MRYIEMEQEISCQQMQIEDLTRTVAQQAAVIAEQKNHIKGHLEIQQIHLEHIDEQSELIEKLAGALESIANNTCCSDCHEAKLVAMKAL